MEKPTILFKLVKVGEIPPNIRKLQERLDFYPGECLTKENFSKLFLVEKEDEMNILCKTENDKSIISNVKFEGKEKTEARKPCAKQKALMKWGTPNAQKYLSNKLKDKENKEMESERQNEKSFQNVSTSVEHRNTLNKLAYNEYLRRQVTKTETNNSIQNISPSAKHQSSLKKLSYEDYVKREMLKKESVKRKAEALHTECKKIKLEIGR